MGTSEWNGSNLPGCGCIVTCQVHLSTGQLPVFHKKACFGTFPMPASPTPRENPGEIHPGGTRRRPAQPIEIASQNEVITVPVPDHHAAGFTDLNPFLRRVPVRVDRLAAAGRCGAQDPAAVFNCSETDQQLVM